MVDRSFMRATSAEHPKNCMTCNSSPENGLCHFELTSGFGGPVMLEGWYCSIACWQTKKDEWQNNRKPLEVQDVLD